MEENKIFAPNGDFSVFDDVKEKEEEIAKREAKIKEDEVLPPDEKAILEVRHLKKYFTLKKTVVLTICHTVIYMLVIGKPFYSLLDFPVAQETFRGTDNTVQHNFFPVTIAF